MDKTEEIKELALVDPIIRNYLIVHKMGHMSYEQALEGMVIDFCKDNNRLRKDLVKLLQTSKYN